MSLILRNIACMVACMIPLLCASCLSTGLVKPVSIDDTNLVDSWELLAQVNDKGEEDPPITKTVIEFTKDGELILTRTDKENSAPVKTKKGKYSINKGEITITDDEGNTATWPYQLTGDTLVVVTPEQKKFRWRRLR